MNDLQTAWETTVHDAAGTAYEHKYPMSTTFCREVAASYGIGTALLNLVGLDPIVKEMNHDRVHRLVAFNHLFPGEIHVSVISQLIATTPAVSYEQVAKFVQQHYEHVQIEQHDTMIEGFGTQTALGFRLTGDATTVCAFFWATKLFRDGDVPRFDMHETHAQLQADVNSARYMAVNGIGPLDMWYDLTRRTQSTGYNSSEPWYPYKLKIAENRLKLYLGR